MFINLNSKEKINSINKQTFSSVDLKITNDDYGIVFPYSINVEKNTINTSSIIDHHNLDENILIKNTETRKVNSNKKQDKLIYTKIPTISIEYTKQNKNEINIFKNINYVLTQNELTDDIIKHCSNIIDILSNIKFNAVLSIDESKISAIYHHQLSLFDYGIDDYDYEYSYMKYNPLSKLSKNKSKTTNKKKNKIIYKKII